MTTAKENYDWLDPSDNDSLWQELGMLKARVNELAEIPNVVNSKLIQMQNFMDVMRRDIEELRKATHDQ